MEAAQAERAEVDIQLAIVDLDQADELLPEGLAHVDPVLVPADQLSQAYLAPAQATPNLRQGCWFPGTR